MLYEVGHVDWVTILLCFSVNGKYKTSLEDDAAIRDTIFAMRFVVSQLLVCVAQAVLTS